MIEWRLSKSDRKLAKILYRNATEENDPEAQFLLSMMYANGVLPHNPSKAIDWCQKSADQGHG